MQISIQLGPDKIPVPKDEADASCGAVVCFFGVVRNTEEGKPIHSLFYEAYQPMAENLIREIFDDLARLFPCTSAEVIHRLGMVPAGETSLFVRIRSPHRAEAFHLLTGFLDRLKQDVPIWKTRP